MRKARRLPMPGPGIAVHVPLQLLPAYLELYGLEPVGYQHPKLLVRRTQTKEKDNDGRIDRAAAG